MSSLNDILASQAKLEARHESSKTISIVDGLIEQIEQQRTAIREGRKDARTVSRELERSVEHFSKAMADDQKETYIAQSRHGKAIAKRFKTDLTAATDPGVFRNKQHLINNAIVLNFVRQGRFELAKSFAAEAKLEIDSTLLHNFETMYAITQSLDRDDLSDAIAWASKNRAMLQERSSTLEFQLHKTQFIRMFNTSHVFKCIEYAQLNFPRFATQHLKEIQQLMASIAFHSSIATSPYAHLFRGGDGNASVKKSFVDEFTAVLSMTPIPPLSTTIAAASLALPTLIKLSSLKLTTQPSTGANGPNDATNETGGDSGVGTSGVDLPIPNSLRFHSVFVCPVTKEVGGEAYMLACGHVIGGDALHSLSRGTAKLKCPYCPAISEVIEAVKLTF